MELHLLLSDAKIKESLFKYKHLKNINMKLRYLSGIILLAGALLTTACSNDDNYTVATGNIVTEITTGDAVVTAVGADIDGTVKDLSSASSASYKVGVIYGTSKDPTSDGTEIEGSLSGDSIETSLTGLTTGTTYYYATYVCLQNRVYRYGDVKSFVTTNAKTVTNDATNISYTKATFSADFSGLEGLDSPEKGIKISIDKDNITNARDFEITTISGLLPGTTYYYAAYVKVGDGYVFGETKELTTLTQTMEYVDLGLSVKWAKYNIGAEEEEGVGAYFGYGDKTAEQYSDDNSDYPSENIAGTELDITNNLNIDGTSVVLSTMPTLAQVKELINNTTSTVETVNGVKGVRFTAINGNSIFLPYTGYRDEDDIIGDGKASYWIGEVSSVNSDYANTLTFDEDGVVTNGYTLRHYGIPLRTVRSY